TQKRYAEKLHKNAKSTNKIRAVRNWNPLDLAEAGQLRPLVRVPIDSMNLSSNFNESFVELFPRGEGRARAWVWRPCQFGTGVIFWNGPLKTAQGNGPTQGALALPLAGQVPAWI